MTLIAISWDDTAGRDGRGAVRLIDQTLLPGSVVDRVTDTTDDLVEAIAVLAVRGAPALGVAGAMGVVVAMDEGAREGWDEARIQAAVDRVRDARPTAVNLAWGVDQVRPLMGNGRDAVLAAARQLAAEDEAANRELSRLGGGWPAAPGPPPPPPPTQAVTRKAEPRARRERLFIRITEKGRRRRGAIGKTLTKLAPGIKPPSARPCRMTGV